MTGIPQAKLCPFCRDAPEIEIISQMNRAWPEPDKWNTYEANCCGISMDLEKWNTRADLPPAVDPLEWEKIVAEDFIATTPIHVYEIAAKSDEEWLLYIDDKPFGPSFFNLQAALDYANEIHRNRVLSCLVGGE